MTSSAEAAFFWVLAPISVIAALGLIFARKAVHAAIGMAITMTTLGVFYLMQKADFLGVIQVFVYTGAVMMLFLFVIMLVGVDSSDSLVETIKGHRWISMLVAIGLIGLLVSTIGSATFDEATVQAGMDRLESSNATTGNITGMANLIFGQYVWIFEVLSAVLITAAVAAMVLAHRERLAPKLTQAEWAAKRIRDNRFVAGLPALTFNIFSMAGLGLGTVLHTFPPQRGRHAGPAAGRHTQQGIRVPGPHRARAGRPSGRVPRRRAPHHRGRTGRA